MGFYRTPAEMYEHRAARFKRDGDRHWAMAKHGEHPSNYAKARFCYEQASVNSARAEHARQTNATFRR